MCGAGAGGKEEEVVVVVVGKEGKGKSCGWWGKEIEEW